MLIDLHLNPATTEWTRYLECSQAADEAGFDGLWVYDHLSGAVLHGDTMLEGFSLLGALSTATRRIALGTMVVNAATRHPGLLAAAAASIQTMSGGRLILGLGAGAAPGTRWSAEFDALGIELGATMAARHALLATTLETVRSIWSDGERYPGFAVPDPVPPVIVGLNSVRLAQWAAVHTDGINILLMREQHAEVIAAARAARPPELGPLLVTVTTLFDESLLDPEHPNRAAINALQPDRLILSMYHGAEPARITRPR